jgi:hypothetical protein
LPQYPSIRTFSGELVSPFELRIPTFEHQKIERSRQLHRDIADHHARNRQRPEYATMSSTAIVGVGQPTVETARLLANGTLAVDGDPASIETDGDGVVPRFSAEAGPHGGFNGRSLYVPQSSGMLPSDPIVHRHVRDLLAEDAGGLHAPPDTPLPRFTIRRTTSDQMRVDAEGVALSVPKPFYKVGQKVEIWASAMTATGHRFAARCPVAVKVEQIAAAGRRAPSVTVRMAPVAKYPGWFVGQVKATAAGTYRAMAVSREKSLAPFRVSELFEVDAGK